MSEKKKMELTQWLNVKRERAKLIIQKFGILLCEYCHKPVSVPDGHHFNRHRNGLENNRLENCRIVHRYPCHQYITDHDVEVISLL